MRSTIKLKTTTLTLLFFLFGSLLLGQGNVIYIDPTEGDNNDDGSTYGLPKQTLPDGNIYGSTSYDYVAGNIYLIQDGEEMNLDEMHEVNISNITISNYWPEDWGSSPGKPTIKQTSNFTYFGDIHKRYLLSLVGSDITISNIILNSDDSENTYPNSCIKVLGNNITIEQCEFFDYEEYGVRAFGSTSTSTSSLEVLRCRFVADQLVTLPQYGVWSDHTFTTVSFCLFQGGQEGVCVESDVSVDEVYLFNNTFWDITDSPLEITNARIDRVMMYNNIFDSDNWIAYIPLQSSPDPTPILTAENNCFNNYIGILYNGSSTIPTGNLDWENDPTEEVVFADASASDFRLPFDSKLINAGKTYGSNLIDYAGTMVPFSSGNYDIGAFEMPFDGSYHIDPTCSGPFIGTKENPMQALPSFVTATVTNHTFKFRQETEYVLTNTWELDDNYTLSSYGLLGDQGKPSIRFDQTGSFPGLLIDDITNVTISNLNLYGTTLPLSNTTELIKVVGNSTETVVISNNHLSTAIYGIYVNCSGSNLEIANCNLSNTTNSVINIEYFENVHITHCDIHNYGIIPVSGITSSYCNSIEIDNNTVDSENNNGIYFYESTGSVYNNKLLGDNSSMAIMMGNSNILCFNNFINKYSEGILGSNGSYNIHHNIIKNSHSNGIWLLNGSQTTSSNINNNVIYSSATTLSNYTAISASTSGSINITNNIIQMEALTGMIYDFSANVTSDYNAIPSTTNFPNCIKYDGTLYSTLTDYQSATGGNCATYTIQQDPQFTDPDQEDFTLLPGSPCLDAGLNNSYVSDYSGNISPNGTTVDIGPIEHYAAPEEINFLKQEPVGWYFATSEIVKNHPNLKQGNIYHGDELVNIRGVNWSGIGIQEGSPPLGLWEVDYDDFLQTIASKGFNTIRLVYSAQIVKNYIDGTEAQITLGIKIGIGFEQNESDLYNKTEYEILEAIISMAETKGLYILLDHHGMEYPNGLWYDPLIPGSEDDYIETIEQVCQDFGQYSNIIGIDLINEPIGATWSNDNMAHNFLRFVEKASEAILDETTGNPDWLVFAEGIWYHGIESLELTEDTLHPTNPSEQYNWGENLTAVQYYVPNQDKAPEHKLIYSPHTYQHQHASIRDHLLNSTKVETNAFISDLNDYRWGNLLKEDGLAVIPGEFAYNAEESTQYPASSGNYYSFGELWFPYFINYMAESKLPGSFYWFVNAVDDQGLTWEVNPQNGVQTWDYWDDNKLNQLYVLYGIVKGTAPMVNDTLYSPRDGTEYNFLGSGLVAASVVKHVAHWAGEVLMSTELTDAIDNIDVNEQYTILHEFEVSCSTCTTTTSDFSISIQYTENELGWVNEESLSLYRYESGAWVDLVVSPDLTKNTITYSTDQFGIYAVFGNKKNAQRVELEQGWNLISTYIDPQAPYGPDIEVVFEDVIDLDDPQEYVEIIKNGAGQVYWPGQIDLIDDMALGEGYQIKMNQTFFVLVKGINVENTSTSIPVGWSILGYMKSYPCDAGEIFEPIDAFIDIVKDESGATYWPLYGLNLIYDMKPGEGYQTKMLTAKDLDYSEDDCSLTSKSSDNNTNMFKYFVEDLYINTDNFMIVGIPFNSWTIPPQLGDEIAAIGENGQLVGKATFNEGFTAITIYGDDQYTPEVVENLSSGESFTFDHWNAQSKSINSYKFKKWARGDGEFFANKISVVGIDEKVENQIFNLEVYPNPGNGEFMLKIISSEKCEAVISVYDIQGRSVSNEMIDLIQGSQTHVLDLSLLKDGPYYFSLTSKEHIQNIKIIISK